MDPQKWMGQFNETVSNTIDMATQNMKTWNEQVRQTLAETSNTINSTMDNINRFNSDAYKMWETNMHQLKETYQTSTNEVIEKLKK